MSLYHREKAGWLRESLESIGAQTLHPREVVLVLDGPVGEELTEVVRHYEEVWSPGAGSDIELRVVRLEENMGLGRALAEGMKHCTHELVARMDTDDVMLPHRLERQAAFMTAHPEVAVCGAWIDEFVTGDDGGKTVVATRRLPEDNEGIRAFGAGRNPMNHPVVMFRREAVAAAGGYEHFPLFEDYYLWVRMLVKGFRFHNLQESLLLFRQNPDMYRRRGGFRYACDEVRFQRAICRLGFIPTSTLLKNVCIRFGVRVMPNGLRELIYRKLLRQ